uniref:NADH-ubiquinone oxidoreductase chain 4 n=1 Tax=Typhlodromus pineus TaxID=3061201 RepID=A0AAU6QDW0_9ACAR
MFFNFILMFLMLFWTFNYFELLIILNFIFLMFLMKLNNLNEYMNFNFLFYEDNLSFTLNYLSLFLIFMVFLNFYKNKNFVIKILLMLMLMALIFCFFMDNLLYMYLFFEMSLFPLLMMLFYKGMNLERIKANFYLLTYMLIGSLYLLLMLMKFNMNLSIFNKFMELSNFKLSILWILALLIFLMKLPMFSIHLWLPKAHVEASVEGSMLLAGILLKLGSYGLIRLMNFVYIKNKKFLSLLLLISLAGSMFIGMTSLHQIDMKMMIAYSSISHMGLMLSSLMTLNNMSLSGVLALMLGHGFCSSSMFFMSNLFYERLKTRNLMMLKGMNQIYYLMIKIWLILCLCNMGVPPFMNFFSELILIFSLMKFSLILIFLLIILLMMNTIYGLNLYVRLNNGCPMLINYSKNIYHKDMMILIFHIFFIIFFMLKPNHFFLFIM